ncbi:c-type cytochrome [Roseivivax sp. GX 12232]|uniref:c-type cytochrome n=1 Tax=Roseivivax sp. GX 12232 TaxID=2900547 RepID=UPI001E51F24F|nr:c-type cytochrome [Roseivivax sp. GX 12232]MCE0507325.1 c-type cytochrome [Roseivivax sp. GX 12232]
MRLPLLLAALTAFGGGAALAGDTSDTAGAEGAATGAETAEIRDIDVSEADTAQGEKAYQAVCRNCHGPKAQGVASYPRLSDKEVAYLVDRLETYRSGEKIGPNSMLMIPHAKELSDEEILNIAVYVTTAFE